MHIFCLNEISLTNRLPKMHTQRAYFFIHRNSSTVQIHNIKKFYSMTNLTAADKQLHSFIVVITIRVSTYSQQLRNLRTYQYNSAYKKPHLTCQYTIVMWHCSNWKMKFCKNTHIQDSIYWQQYINSCLLRRYYSPHTVRHSLVLSNYHTQFPIS